MGENVILFPYCIAYDNRHSFAFTVEMARKINACVITLTTYNIEYKDLLTVQAYRKAAEKEKNKIYYHLLELRGYYQGQFNKWKSFDDIIFKNIINEGGIEFNLLQVLKNKNLLIIITNHNNHTENRLFSEFMLTLFDKYKPKCLILPEDTEFYTVDSNLPAHLFKKQKDNKFMQMLTRSEMLNLPEDLALFKNELAVIN